MWPLRYALMSLHRVRWIRYEQNVLQESLISLQSIVYHLMWNIWCDKGLLFDLYQLVTNVWCRKSAINCDITSVWIYRFFHQFKQTLVSSNILRRKAIDRLKISPDELHLRNVIKVVFVLQISKPRWGFIIMYCLN